MVLLRADDPLVDATTCLAWQPATALAGVARVALAQAQMIRAFLSRCSIPRGGAGGAASRRNDEHPGWLYVSQRRHGRVS